MPTLTIELKRAFGNRWFVLSLAALTIVAAFQAFQDGATFSSRLDVTVYPYLDSSYWYITTFSSYGKWLPLQHIKTPTELFFVLCPFLVLMGYSWSLASDFKSGYADQLATRASRAQCYTARAVATFLAAGTIAAVPFLVNFATLALFLPSWTPDFIDRLYLMPEGVASGADASLFNSLFYTSPALFVLARTALNFALCGAWATLVLALSLFVHNRVALIALPYIGLFLVKYLGEMFYVLMRTNGFENFGRSITLFDQLRALPDGFYCPGWLTLVCLALMLAVSIGVPYLVRKRDVL